MKTTNDGTPTGTSSSGDTQPIRHTAGARDGRPGAAPAPSTETGPRISSLLGPLPEDASRQQTRDLNDAVHRVLVVGLALSSALLIVGLILDVARGSSLPVETLAPLEALHRMAELRPSGALSLGLLVLMFTPVVRVIGSVIVFVWERDWRYTLITLTVLAIMLTSILLGRS